MTETELVQAVADHLMQTFEISEEEARKAATEFVAEREKGKEFVEELLARYDN